jgi:hypothetical protein
MEQLTIFLAAEADLDKLLEGNPSGPSFAWPTVGARPSFTKSDFVVLCKQLPFSSGKVKPVAIGVRQGQEARLYARYSQTRGDLSPLSSWLHVFPIAELAQMHTSSVEASLGGYEASWAGLVIAEAAILSGRSASQLKMVPCLATPSFAVARVSALWPSANVEEVVQSYDKLQSEVRGNHEVGRNHRSALEPIWQILRALSGLRASLSKEQDAIVSAIQSISRSRNLGVDEVDAIREGLWLVPESAMLDKIETRSAEDRLRIFDQLVKTILGDPNSNERRLSLSFLAAFVSTMAAGGSSSLSLAEEVSDPIPEILAFAYVLAGSGEHASWSGAFDGLGRLVSREITRTFSLEEGPSCDFLSSEALVLVDRELKDRLVYLKLKQTRVATAAIMPGVNIQLPFAEALEQPRNREAPPQPRVVVDPLAALADALMPYLLDTLAANQQPRTTPSGRSKRGGGRRD